MSLPTVLNPRSPLTGSSPAAFRFAFAFTLTLALTFALAGGGCSDDGPTLVATPSDGAAPAPATDASVAPCPTDDGPVDPTALIDDFEDGTSAALWLAGRMANWYAAGDGTSTAIMQPLGDAPPEPIPGGRCGSRHALHVTGAGFAAWGSQVGLPMRYGPNAAGVSGELPYDARARGYQGVTFFARVGNTSVTTVRFAISDQYARPEAGLCTLNGAPANNCYDTFGVTLSQTLTTEWREIRIPWTGLSQQNFGLQGGIVPDVSQLYDIGFTFPGHVVFDLWIDDLRFY